MKPEYYRTGLIGYPLGHSLSPLIHRAMYESQGIDGEYNLYPFESLPAGEPALLDLLRQMKDGILHGLNVTIPHKQTILPYLDSLSKVASQIGAVNTIYLRDGLLIGDNTDVDGFMTDVKRYLPGKVNNALILGAGGAARAAAYGLLQNQCRLYISSRRIEQARHLAENLRVAINHNVPEIFCVELNREGLEKISTRIDLIVNATPVGMSPKVDESPWVNEVPFPAHAAVYDMVYNPARTRLVRDAAACGLQATTGMGMLIGQAALSFERWTAARPEYEVVKEMIKESLWR